MEWGPWFDNFITFNIKFSVSDLNETKNWNNEKIQKNMFRKFWNGIINIKIKETVTIY